MVAVVSWITCHDSREVGGCVLVLSSWEKKKKKTKNPKQISISFRCDLHKILYTYNLIKADYYSTYN